MRIMITGGAGYIGKVLYLRLKDRDVPSLTVSSMDRRFDPCISRADFTEADILDEGKVRKALKGVDVVVHLAAIPYVASVEEDLIAATRVNVDGTRIVTEAAQDASRIVYLSTSGVYGPQEGRIDESSELRPISRYAEQKLVAENIIRSSGVPCVVLRASNLYGLGADLPPGPLIHQMLERGIGSGVVPVSSSYMMRNFLHVQDCAEAIVASCFYSGQGDTYNIGNDDIRLGEVAEKVKRALFRRGIEVRIEKGMERPAEPLLYVHERASRDIGFHPKVPIEEGIEQALVHLLGRK